MPALLTPDIRIININRQQVHTTGDYVLYWMIANRRLQWNYALDRAVEEANRLQKPLLIVEALRCGYRWASDRIHRFIIEGMRDNATYAASLQVAYHPYVEPQIDAGKRMIEELSQRACCVVTDHFPCFFLPRMVRQAGEQLSIRLEAVDSNGIYPLQHANRDFSTAASFRRHLQKTIHPFIIAAPHPSPLQELQRKQVDVRVIQQRWPAADIEALLQPNGLSSLPIDHTVKAIQLVGGRRKGLARMTDFIAHKLARYHTDRSSLKQPAASGLSPYLHFGHVSVHELVSRIIKKEAWSLSKTAAKASGSRQGWWGMSEGTEAFLDELITWRELGYVFSHQHPHDYDKLSSLPDWAKKTIAEHRDDDRPIVYTFAQLDAAQTHDELWNCAQRQLRREGVMHNYIRMLWGKKIYEWSETAEEALQNLIELNNRYAIDGRNPNSYSGIFWIMGRFDRAWGPVRPIFGKLRYMTSDSTRRKLKAKSYMSTYARSLFD